MIRLRALNWKYLVFFVLLILVASVGLVWFLEYRYFLNSADAAWNFFGEHNEIFWYSSFLMGLVLVILCGVLRRPVIAVGVMSAVLVMVTYAHINKFMLRDAPLLPEDFGLLGEAGSLMEMVDGWGLVRTVMAVGLILGLTFFANRWVNRKLIKQKKSKWKGTVGGWLVKWGVAWRVIFVVAGVWVFAVATDFVRNHASEARVIIPELNVVFYAEDQGTNYKLNGFILGFLYNFGGFRMAAPDGYGEEEIDEIRAKYQAAAESDERVSLADEEVSVVIILNESFYDMEIIEEFYPHTGGDVTPNLHAIEEKYPHGMMYSPVYGGGTANVEFEVLTGLTNYWAKAIPYVSILPNYGKMESLVSDFKRQGYSALAIHPYNQAMYKRNVSYKNLGFDEFVSDDDMTYRDTEGNARYINDRSAYREVVDRLDNKGNQFILLVTMQNHMPYYAGTFMELDFSLTDMEDAQRRSDIETYLQLLNNSDRYLGELIEDLDEMEKKVVVLFFGDHAPGLFHLVNEHEDKAVRDLAHMVPYFVYANFDVGGGRVLPETTPNCLGNAMLDVVGATKPVLYYLLDEVCGGAPILASAYLGVDGVVYSDVVREYEMVNYDLLGGEGFWVRRNSTN
jgi:phosphoglycerol transferase MdoB-like AlkP superfamily enzyme